ncbi:MAG TPA: hypothetical protein VLE95_03965 [Chlamydiales bacterium]|nr:hypothetical protein [Chlamydiales bacterium]
MSINLSNVIKRFEYLYKNINTYLPYIAAGNIVRKIAFSCWRHNQTEREIRQLTKAIKLKKSLQGQFKKSEKFKNVEKYPFNITINQLTEKLKETKRKKQEGYLSYLAIPSLAFPHPGSNPYQGVHQLAGQGFKMRNTLNHPIRSTGNLTKITALGAGVIGIVGSVVALGKVIGILPGENRVVKLAINLALAVNVTEIALEVLRKLMIPSKKQANRPK